MPTTPNTPLSDARDIMRRAFATLRSRLSDVHEAVRHANALCTSEDAVRQYAALAKERNEVDAAFALIDGILWREVSGK